MAKLTIPEGLKGKELYRFLIANKAELIAQKKALPKFTEAWSYTPDIFSVKAGAATKADGAEIPADATSVRVKLVANAANWCDSQWDVLIPDCWTKTIKDGKGKVHLHDHIYRLDAQIGDVASIYSQDIALSELGLSMSGSTQCLIYESDVLQAYNPFCFQQYKTRKINQHSIGLNYVKIELAINDEESEKEYDFWKKYYDQVINKEVVDKYGFFWVVSEIKLLEVSAVLFGSNELTPTLNVSGGTKNQPPSGTGSQLPHEPGFDLSKAIKETQFI